MNETNNTAIYYEILQLFVGDNDQLPVLKKPFEQGNYIIATDSHIIIYIKKKFLPFHNYPNEQYAPNALSLLPGSDNAELIFHTQEIHDFILLVKKYVKDKYNFKKIACPDCSGEGFVNFEFHDHAGIGHTVKETCPFCEGDKDFTTTIITDKKTGDIVPEFNVLIGLEHTFLEISYFERIVETAKLLSVEAFQIVRFSNSAVKFIVGDCEILLAPYQFPDDDDLTFLAPYYTNTPYDAKTKSPATLPSSNSEDNVKYMPGDIATRCLRFL